MNKVFYSKQLETCKVCGCTSKDNVINSKDYDIKVCESCICDHYIFIGYDIPAALDMKHTVLIPWLDKRHTRVEIAGDILHKVPSMEEVHYIEDLICLINDHLDMGLTVGIEYFNDLISEID